LLYTCKHVRWELEPIICKAIARSILDTAKKIRDRGDDIAYTPPTAFHGWLSLTVSRLMTTYMFTCNDPFWGLRDFRFNTFTIAFDGAHDGYEPYVGPQRPLVSYERAASIIGVRLGAFADTRRPKTMKRWVLDWSACSSPIMEHLGKSITLMLACKRWDADAKTDDEDNLMRVCFYRTPMLKS
jgi:hypothetical protein